MNFTPPKKPSHYPDRQIDCQVALDNAFRELWENTSAAGWGPEEIAAALYELTDNRQRRRVRELARAGPANMITNHFPVA